VDKSRLDELNLWEGDRLFFRLLEEKTEFFSLKLRYEGDKLVEAVLDGKPEICGKKE
jgi:8-oxo-dGTP diphosphatase